MVYFQISPVGFNCGTDKNNCNRYPDFCKECVKTQLERFGLDLKHNIKFTIIDSEEKRIQMFQDIIWQKFLDVLNLKHILLMTKVSGLPILDYPISGAGVNTELLTGFIQANITFSEKSTTSNGIEKYGKKHQFYEFHYETFNILLKNGEFIRICMVLDHQASNSLKTLVTEFLREYEVRYLDRLERVVNTGMLNFEDTIDFIIDTFNIKLVFPMILTHTFLPEMLESIKKNPIQKAIVDFAKQFLASKQFFFIINLLDEVQKIVNIDANLLLYEISLLLERNIIIPTTIEFAETKILQFQETQAIRIANNELISSLISNDDEINELKEKAKYMDEDDVKTAINTYLRKAETAERALIYKEAQKEYEKALYLATGFDIKGDIGRISFMVLELDKKIKELDLEYTINAGEKAEKRKDYINAINYYRQGLIILRETEVVNGNESRIKKLEKKIKNLQKYL
jgi:tetratricopeptide (TPR) repeat protein